jgi:hypothetical protein
MATEAQDAAVRWLAPHQDALLSLARLILDAPEHSLSGDALEAAIERVLPGAVSTLYGDVG